MKKNCGTLTWDGRWEEKKRWGGAGEVWEHFEVLQLAHNKLETAKKWPFITKNDVCE